MGQPGWVQVVHDSNIETVFPVEEHLRKTMVFAQFGQAYRAESAGISTFVLQPGHGICAVGIGA